MKVEKGVDIPKVSGKKGCPVKYEVLRSMEVGDSIACDTEKDMHRLRSAAFAYARGNDKQFNSRIVIENDRRVWRLWRVK